MTTKIEHPIITVIVAVRNGSESIQDCIDSFVSQTYPAKELIVIDGNSSDGTVQILKRNESVLSYWVSEPDKGIYNAWNKGLDKANGKWICFLGADDYLWSADALQQMADHIAGLPETINIVYGQVMLLNSNNENIFMVGVPWNKAKPRFPRLMSIPHPGAMHRRTLFEQHGKFDESFRIAGDYELLLRELKNSDASFAEGLVIAGMRQGGVSSNPNNTIEQLREARVAQKRHGFNIPSRLWLTAMLKAYLRVFFWRLFGEHRTRQLLDLARRACGLPKFWTKT